MSDTHILFSLSKLQLLPIAVICVNGTASQAARLAPCPRHQKPAKSGHNFHPATELLRKIVRGQTHSAKDSIQTSGCTGNEVRRVYGGGVQSCRNDEKIY